MTLNRQQICWHFFTMVGNVWSFGDMRGFTWPSSLSWEVDRVRVNPARYILYCRRYTFKWSLGAFCVHLAITIFFSSVRMKNDTISKIIIDAKKNRYAQFDLNKPMKSNIKYFKNTAMMVSWLLSSHTDGPNTMNNKYFILLSCPLWDTWSQYMALHVFVYC